MAFAFTALGQAKDDCSPNYDLAARFSPKKVGKMVFSTSVRPNWFKNSDKFWYSYKTPQGTQYYIVDPSTGSKREIFNMAQLAAQLTEIVKDPFDAQNIPIQKLALKDDKKFTFEIRSTAEIEKKDEKSGKPKRRKRYSVLNTISQQENSPISRTTNKRNRTQDGQTYLRTNNM